MKLDHNQILKSLVELDKKGKDLDDQIQATRYQIHDLLWMLIKARQTEVRK